MLDQPATLVWTVDAASHAEAMSAYYSYRGLGEYVSDHPEWEAVSYREHGWE